MLSSLTAKYSLPFFFLSHKQFPILNNCAKLGLSFDLKLLLNIVSYVYFPIGDILLRKNEVN